MSTPTDLVAARQARPRRSHARRDRRDEAVDVPELGTLENSNKLLGTHGVDGIKTGTTDDAANLLFSADFAVGSSTVTVVGVLLGGESHAVLRSAIAALLDSVAPGFHEVAPLEAGQQLAEYDTPWGDSARARAADGASVVVWSDTPVEVEVRAEPVSRSRPAATRSERRSCDAGAQEVTVPLVLDAAHRRSRRVVASHQSRCARRRDDSVRGRE